MTRHDFEARYAGKGSASDIAWVSGQWLGSGVCIVATIWATGDGYYLCYELEDEQRDRAFCRENNRPEDGVNSTRDFCDRYGYEPLGKEERYAVEKANRSVAEEIGREEYFWLSESGDIEGN